MIYTIHLKSLCLYNPLFYCKDELYQLPNTTQRWLFNGNLLNLFFHFMEGVKIIVFEVFYVKKCPL